MNKADLGFSTLKIKNMNLPKISTIAPLKPSRLCWNGRQAGPTSLVNLMEPTTVIILISKLLFRLFATNEGCTT